MEFSVTNRGRIISLLMMAIGVISLILGYMYQEHDQFWANLLINGLFFTFISLGALFFIALQYATEAAWSMMVRRIYEAVSRFLPYGIGLLLVVFIGASLHMNHIYHWMDPAATHEYVLESSLGSGHPHFVDTLEEGAVVNEEYDSIIAGKSAFLNLPFWWIRNIIYFGIFLFFMNYFRKQSLREDKEGGINIHMTNYRRGALFLVFFAVFSSTLSWDWVMSIDTHWFSTMFGWYTFSGMWVTSMIVSLILVLYLKSKGLLPNVNDSHVHDMGKWVFATSFLWTYLWFSQFMLIWYSDIPEEVTYFQSRFETYGVPMFTMMFINFALPMLVLMSRDAKRNVRLLITISTIIFFGHWFDVYLMVIPGVMFEHWAGIHPTEIGMMIGFLGLFILVTLRALASARLVPENSPYLEESIQHSI
jgi:hypothetical protein